MQQAPLKSLPEKAQGKALGHQPKPQQPPAPPPALYTHAGVLEGAKAKQSAAVAAAAPAPAGSGFVATGGEVVVDILNSDSGYNNRIYWSTDNFKTMHYIGIDNHTASVNLGSFAAGTRIEFGIVNGVNEFYRTGPASANADHFEHARVTTTASGTQIGFEDLRGGGDRDFNDVIIAVRNAAPPAPAPAPAPAPTEAAKKAAPAKKEKAAKTNNNRSGLGDGTNPGQGAGRANSPNTGTNNPNAARAPITASAPAPASAGGSAEKLAATYGAAVMLIESAAVKVAPVSNAAKKAVPAIKKK